MISSFFPFLPWVQPDEMQKLLKSRGGHYFAGGQKLHASSECCQFVPFLSWLVVATGCHCDGAAHLWDLAWNLLHSPSGTLKLSPAPPNCLQALMVGHSHHNQPRLPFSLLFPRSSGLWGSSLGVADAPWSQGTSTLMHLCSASKDRS